MAEEKNKKSNQKQRLTDLVYSIVTAIVSQLIILNDLFVSTAMQIDGCYLAAQKSRMKGEIK